MLQLQYYSFGARKSFFTVHLMSTIEIQNNKCDFRYTRNEIIDESVLHSNRAIFILNLIQDFLSSDLTIIKI